MTALQSQDKEGTIGAKGGEVAKGQRRTCEVNEQSDKRPCDSVVGVSRSAGESVCVATFKQAELKLLAFHLSLLTLAHYPPRCCT